MRVDDLWRRLLYVFRRRQLEQELTEELQLHLEMKQEELEASGLDADAAAKEARRIVGNAPLARDQSRDVWVWPWLQGFELDCRLALRMLVKYPGLTVVGGLAMAFGIGAGVGGFEILTQVRDPVLPLEEGDRIVGIENVDLRTGKREPRLLHDFALWREQLESIDELSAVRETSKNLITEDAVEPVRVAEVSASAFDVARVPPLKGRTFVEDDNKIGAASVVVLGYDLWQRRFSGDPGVIGRVVRLGTTQAEVVGVMPQGFTFPVSHQLWTPLRLNVASPEPLDGPGLVVFGRLAPRFSRDQAQAELAVIGRLAATASPGTHEHLEPRLVSYAWSFFSLDDFWLAARLGNLFLAMLLVLACANVALLMVARAASRETETAVRNALGASRSRIVAQTFVEALALSVVAALLGLAAARYLLATFWRMVEADRGAPLPFWFRSDLSPSTIVYACLLALFAAAIAGALPGLVITDKSRQARLSQASAGGGGVRLGGVWTITLIAQVAATVAFPATAFFFHRWAVDGQTRDIGIPTNEYLSTRLAIDREALVAAPESAAVEEASGSLPVLCAELGRRLLAEPGVTGVTFGSNLPGTLHASTWIEVEDEPVPRTSRLGFDIALTSVAPGFFEALDAPVLSGRDFSATDARLESAGVVIVNQSFVDAILGGRDPIGRRLRRSGLGELRPPGPWQEVIGVVPDLGMVGGRHDPAGVYFPLSEKARGVFMAVHVRGKPTEWIPRLRRVAGDLDPALRLEDLMGLDAAAAGLWLESQYASRLLSVLSAIALLLSLTAIYSVMTFAVCRRTREIGVRVTLGAGARRVLLVIFRRPLVQISAGVLLGAGLVTLLSYGVRVDAVGAGSAALAPSDLTVIAAYSLAMMAVCLLACIVPVRRALSVEPAEVLRAD